MKTIEEAAVDYAQKVYPQINGEHEVDIDGAIISNSANSFIAGIEFAQQWISVKDELPEKHKDCIVKVANFDNIILFGYQYKGKWYQYYDDSELNVTHWRPIELK